jgi:hypothetical protein
VWFCLFVFGSTGVWTQESHYHLSHSTSPQHKFLIIADSLFFLAELAVYYWLCVPFWLPLFFVMFSSNHRAYFYVGRQGKLLLRTGWGQLQAFYCQFLISGDFFFFWSWGGEVLWRCIAVMECFVGSTLLFSPSEPLWWEVTFTPFCYSDQLPSTWSSLCLSLRFSTVARSVFLASTEIKSTQSKLGVVVHNSNPSIQEAKAGGLWAGQKAQEDKKASQSFIDPVLKNKNNKKKDSQSLLRVLIELMMQTSNL